MAPGTVANSILALSRGFQQLGKGNLWINGMGNPGSRGLQVAEGLQPESTAQLAAGY